MMKKAIGIDLGTTNSVVAFKDTSVKILRNKENEELTRSCVALRNEELFVGKTAYQLLERDPVNTLLSVKRLMGGTIKDKMVMDMINSDYYKFSISSLKGGTEDAVAVILGGKQYTPEQISAEILKKIKSDAEEKLGDEVSHAVITVPAYFTEKQKHATKVAARLAGLKVQKLLAEPTAAAIAYGMDNMKTGDAKTVLIYDFGGGTFDLSILNIVDGQYMEAGTGGDRWLGGDDLDRTLQKIVFQKIEAAYNIDDIQSLISDLPDKKRYKVEGQLRKQTEDAKIQLSVNQTAQVLIDSLEDENGDEIDVDVVITRDEFEKAILPYVQRTIDLIDSLMGEMGYEISMIDAILLVGGSSCIPLVKRMVSSKYGLEKVKVAEKPMLTVSEGAAILAHRLGDGEIESEVPIDSPIADVSYSTNHNYYIQIKSGSEFHYDKIIEKQTPLPISVSRTYKTTINNQKLAEVTLFADVENGEFQQQTIGYFSIDENLPNGSEIVFDISLDHDEVFSIGAYPKGNKSKEKRIVLARGNKDAHALAFMSKKLKEVIAGNYSEKQKDYFFKAVQKEINKASALGAHQHDSEEWSRIGTNIYSAFEQAEQLTDDVDEDLMAVFIAKILCAEYAGLIGTATVAAMQSLIHQVETGNDNLEKIALAQKLREKTEEYPVLLTLFTLKLGANAAGKINPADANKLLEMHDQIVQHFKSYRNDEAFALLDTALELKSKYDTTGITLESIHLAK